jgi:large subunit ribosomal protein L6
MALSRTGKLPINIPLNVDVKWNNSSIVAKGKFGTVERDLLPGVIQLHREDNVLLVKLVENTDDNRVLHGLYRTLINNMVIGVSEQFTETLILNGVGYRANIQGKQLILNLGHSHPITMSIPEYISVEVMQNTKINLKSCDKETLGLFAAEIRSWRPPEPYKGKGILYEGEIVNRKAGKSGKK